MRRGGLVLFYFAERCFSMREKEKACIIEQQTDRDGSTDRRKKEQDSSNDRLLLHPPSRSLDLHARASRYCCCCWFRSYRSNRFNQKSRFLLPVSPKPKPKTRRVSSVPSLLLPSLFSLLLPQLPLLPQAKRKKGHSPQIPLQNRIQSPLLPTPTPPEFSLHALQFQLELVPLPHGFAVDGFAEEVADDVAGSGGVGGGMWVGGRRGRHVRSCERVVRVRVGGIVVVGCCCCRETCCCCSSSVLY